MAIPLRLLTRTQKSDKLYVTKMETGSQRVLLKEKKESQERESSKQTGKIAI